MQWRRETLCGTDDPDSGPGKPAGHQCGLLDQGAAQWCRLRQHHLGTAAKGVDHRHRRHTAASASRGGQLSVSEHRQMPPAGAVGCGGDQFADPGQGAQPLSAPQHLHGVGGQVA